MNELQRQMYLSALGVDTYMPRWHLPFAAMSMPCKNPVVEKLNTPTENNIRLELDAGSSISSKIETLDVPPTVTPISNLMIDLLHAKKIIKNSPSPSVVEDKQAQLNSKSSQNISPVIDAFNLSVWRPIENLMIIDSRNTKLALPTELLLNNMLRSFFPKCVLDLKEEVLRWPMVENSFAKHTIVDARTELQTWLSVQCEIRPIKYLWLMGANAATYFLPLDIERSECLWQSVLLTDSLFGALILPSCNELLQQPLQKRQLYSAFEQYHL